MAEFLKHAVKLGHETTIFGFSTSKCIHLSPFTFLQLHICRGTQGNTYELVSRMRAQSNLRPKNPEMPKSPALVPKNMVIPPPPDPYISETAVSYRFRIAYTYLPQGDDILVH